MTPRVSICMPHLNSRPFTEPRMDSILAQTMTDWELVIVDSHSDDGSRQILERYAAGEPRIKIVDGPRDGIYTNLNRALELCRGEFVYIATSDDTMRPECLAEMVGTLQNHPECGVCHCCLEVIDERGQPVSPDLAWENWAQQNYFKQWISKYHVRRAPHDGILHLGMYTVYGSLTQLLVRRNVYISRGLFRTDCSPHADFEWGMRVGLTENVVHIPKSLATWRRHAGQATQVSSFDNARAEGEFRRLARIALQSLEDRTLARSLKRSRLNDFYLVSELAAKATMNKPLLARIAALVGFSFKHPIFSLRYGLSRFIFRRKMTGDFEDAILNELLLLGLPPLLSETDVQSATVDPTPPSRARAA